MNSRRRSAAKQDAAAAAVPAEAPDADYATPLARKTAAQYGVDLATVTASGVGGRIRKQDVIDAAAAADPGGPANVARIDALIAESRRVAGATATQPVSMPGTRKSAFSAATTVRYDPFSLNPLVDDAQESMPHHYRAALAEAPKPTLFNSGDLPVFIASGADPKVLAHLPWQVRHPAASASPGELARLLERYAGEAGILDAELDFGGHDENRAYSNRVQNWLSGISPTDGRPVASTPSADRQRAYDADYAALYGEEDKRKAQAVADRKADDQAQARFQAEQAARLRERQQRR